MMIASHGSPPRRSPGAAVLGDPGDQFIPGEGASGGRFLNTALGAVPPMMPRRICLKAQELVWEVTVASRPERPFGDIESAHEYVDLLVGAIVEARKEVDAEITRAGEEGAERRKQALQLAAYALAKLETHFTTSRRLLNDLRTLRRLLLEERAGPG